MKPLRHTRTIAVVVGLAAVGACSARPSLAQDLGLDFWNVPRLEARIDQLHRHRAALEARNAVVHRRIAVKEALVRELIAGRAGLVEVAAQFRALNAGQPVYAEAIRAHYPGATEGEKYCHNVIGFVEAGLRRDPGCQPTVRRLTEELNRLVAAGGVRLPDVAVPADLVGPGSLTAEGLDAAGE